MADVAVVFGGPSPEHDISILTGLLCERVLRDAGQDVLPIYWTRTGEWVLCPAKLEARDYLDGAPKAGTKLMLDLRTGFGVKKGARRRQTARALRGAQLLPRRPG